MWDQQAELISPGRPCYYVRKEKKKALQSPISSAKGRDRNSVWFGNLMNRICQVSNISCCYTSHAEIGTGMKLDSFFGRYEE